MQTQDLEHGNEGVEGEQPAVAPEPKLGAGVRVLQHYLKSGSPDASVVAGVMTDFPHDQEAMFRLLHKTVGNSFVQEVSAVMAKKSAPAPEAAPEPAAAAPVEEPAAAPTPEAAKPTVAEVSAPTSPAAEAATQVAPATPIVEASELDHHKDKPDYKKKAWAAQREFLELDSEQQRMIDELRPGEGAQVWSELPAVRRAGFLNVTAVMKSNGFPLSGLSLRPITSDDSSGVQQDRLLFTAATAGKLKAPLDAAIAERDARGDKGFIEDKPEDGLHPGMGGWGGRQWVTRFSMQVGGGSGGGFVDIDEFGPKVDVVGTMGHMFEVLRNHTKHVKTDPYTVAKGLHKRGDDP